MIAQFVLLSFATYLIWETVLSLVDIPERLSPVIVFGLACGWGVPLHYSWIAIVAATGGVAILHSLANASGIEPLASKIHLPKRKTKRKKVLPVSGTGHGRRIRDL